MPVTLKSRLPLIQAELPAKVKTSVELGLNDIAEDASERAPKASGELARGYEARDEGIYALWRYHFTEFGTTHSAAQPHLMPAVEAGAPKLYGRVAVTLKRL